MFRRLFRTVARGRSEATPIGLLSGVTLFFAVVAGVIMTVALVAWYAAR